MKRDYIEFQDRSTPLGYLITIRCYGTWLHGDERESVDRKHYNRYGEPKIPSRTGLKESNTALLKYQPFKLSGKRRKAVTEAIREVCYHRALNLLALNVRTNHVHSVISANIKPESAMHSFKAYATRRMREENLVGQEEKVWSRHGSTRYLWTDEHIEKAVDYVINGQGDHLPEFG